MVEKSKAKSESKVEEKKAQEKVEAGGTADIKPRKMKKITWSLNVNVEGGPRFADTNIIDIDAYDHLAVTIPKKCSRYCIEVQPGGFSEVKVLLIRADKYDESGKVTYSVNPDEHNNNKKIKLDSVQIFAGSGLVGLLSDSPKVISFDNDLEDKVSINILVGRNAVQSEPIHTS